MTNYIQNVLDNISDDGMTPELWELVNEDMGNMKRVGVSNNKEKALLFYIRRFLNDILNEFGIKRRPGLTKEVFKILQEKEEVGIEDIRGAVLSCLKTKKAYPNTMGVYRIYNQDKVDINKWIATMADVDKSKDKTNTLEKLTADWNETEKYNFIQWMKYYEENNHMKYGFNKEANYLDFMFDKELEQAIKDPTLEQPEEEQLQEIQPKRPDHTLQDYKKSLISRLRAAEKILDRFSDVLPDPQWDYLYRTLTTLRGEVTKLKVAQTINDRVIRTASIFDDNSFQEGARELRKVAAPAGSLAKRIETALSGGGDKAAPDSDMGGELDMDMPDGELELPGDESPPGDAPAGEADAGGELDIGGPEELGKPPEGDDLDVEEPKKEEEPDLDVPEPEEEPDLDVPEPAGADNPFSGSNPEDVIGLITPLLQNARNRANVRILTKADMMLDGQGSASYFPELSEAIAKQIECDNYIANRLEKIIGKLQGGKGGEPIEGTPPPAAPAPSVDMGEITGEETLDVEEPAVEEVVEEELIEEEPAAEAPPAAPAAEAPKEPAPAAPEG